MSILVASMICLAPCSCNGQKVDNSTIHPLNLQRYLGDWYEIARFDHSLSAAITMHNIEHLTFVHVSPQVSTPSSPSAHPEIATKHSKTVSRSHENE